MMKDFSKQQMYENFYQISLLTNGTYKTADELIEQEQQNLIQYKTGTEGIDELLGGGISNLDIYEIIGLPGSGKTYFCYTVLNTCVKKKIGQIIYLYMGSSYNIDQFYQLFHYNNQSEKSEYESKIKAYSYKTPNDLVMILYCLLQNQKQFNLVIIDNLSLIHISEPTRLGMISYAVFCLKKKKKNNSRIIQYCRQ
eukprot:TRINITY_DN5514_c0_g1_i1.p2 TRINITY_DN5514_c0_g1~~TRINITY_DN5514_c0_g1_i1.p2  ORF type:complete len:196 (+),score=35.34 TRINITY_DN5514_c0_g1_i1:172-759(+)